MTIEFIITFFVFAMSANGLGNLYLYLIRDGQLLSFMQKPLIYFSSKTSLISKFIHKSIGGCDICTIQRFGDLSFLFFMSYFSMPGDVIITSISWFALYCLYGGLIFYFSAIASRQTQPKTTSKKIEL